MCALFNFYSDDPFMLSFAKSQNFIQAIYRKEVGACLSNLLPAYSSRHWHQQVVPQLAGCCGWGDSRKQSYVRISN